MPRGLDSADRKLLIGAGVFFAILVVVGALMTPPQISGASESPSSYSPSWDGAEGAFLLLEQLGYNISRWERPPSELPEDAADQVLILANPSEPPSEEERYDIIEFLENGGRVIATGSAAGAFLPAASEFAEGNPFGAAKIFDAEVPSPIVRGAPQITMTKPSGWSPSVTQVALYGDADTAAVVTYPFGKGQVIWWAAPTPLTNGAIRDSGNLAFFLNCVGPPGNGQVLWDEYFHGARSSLWSFFSRTPVFWGAAQFGLVFLAIVATHSRRLGPARAPTVRSRLSPLEFVDTLGDLYASAHVSAAAIGILYQRFRFSLTRKLGLPIDVPSPELATIASETLGWEQAPLLEALIRCDLAKRSGSAPVEKPLELFQQIHDYAARLELRRTDTNERKPNEQGK
jgi:Domain of unknown function (DUF4350)